MYIGAEAVAVLSNRVRQITVQTRFDDDKTWPPEQPTSFTPLLLIHSKGNRTQGEVTAMAKLMHAGDISKVASATGDHPTIKRARLESHEKCQKVLDTSRATKEIEVILAPLVESQEASFILIEGAPGIGKSMLLKEVVYRWGKQQLLQMYELVLLVCLRDPSLRQVKSVDDLLQLFYKGDKNAPEIINACSEYLSRNGGRTLVLLLDGYDEYPVDLQKCSLIADIIKRQVLPHCGLVVSSRPHALGDFHTKATIRVDILGFTETEREHYIKQALSDQPHKIKELTQYLHQHLSINSICFIPFNMVILLYLYKLGNRLPKNSTELYFDFICSAICRHLTKLGNPLTHDITDLTELPEPYNRIIQQLSKFSLAALNKDKLIFTFDEIKAACPDITTPGAISGLGLLQVVQHFGRYTRKVTLNFIHFTIQEFLAAHYISHLPQNEELLVIKANFWSDIHFNMFSMYTSLTKGQRPAFRKFLSGGNETIAISHKFLKNQLQCLHLYRCFNEANDHKMCDTIERAEIFSNKEIDLRNITLTARDMECISLFLTSSFNKEWKRLDLHNCYIQDKGLNILCRGLHHSSDITINQLDLNSNGLTVQSSSVISELTIKCKVKVLGIGDNRTIGENQQLYSILTDPSNVLEELYMYLTSLSSSAAIALFTALNSLSSSAAIALFTALNSLSSSAAIALLTALKENNKLKELYIEANAITDGALDAITTALESNNCLVKLCMWGNPLSSEAIINIVQCLEVNNTLQLLGLPHCPKGVRENIISLQEVVNERRESRGCPVKLEIEFGFIKYLFS